MAARQFLRITAIGFDAIARLGRRQRGGNDRTADTQLRQLPVQPIPCRSGLITGPHMLGCAQFSNQLANWFRLVRDHTQRSNLTVIRLGNCNRNAVRVDIQSNTSYFRHATNSFRMRLCAAGFSIRSVTRATANWWLVAPL